MKNNYTRKARVYSSLAAMIIPAIILSFVFLYLGIPSIWNTPVATIITSIVPAALINAVAGFFLMELFRSTSKLIFQFPLFSEDETDMPTTKLLMWGSKKRLSDDMINQIAVKVKNEFGITLMTASEERKKKNTLEAKRRVVCAVGQMRELTRGNENLLRYNIQYGFCRNYLGGSVYAILLIAIAIIVNSKVCFMNSVALWVLLTVQIVFDLIFFISLKYRGYAYARALFNAFLTNKK